MKAIRILDVVPSFFDIYLYFKKNDNTRYVFEDTYLFKDNKLPSDEEWEFLDKDKIEIGMDNSGQGRYGQFIVTHKTIDLIGARMRPSANCIHVYSQVNFIADQIIPFSKLDWDWAYHCYDDSMVEIFFNKNHVYAYKSIKENFRSDDIEFPGSINAPGGMSIL